MKVRRVREREREGEGGIWVVATTNGAEVPRGAINLTLFCVYACAAFSAECSLPLKWMSVIWRKKISTKSTAKHSTNLLWNMKPSAQKMCQIMSTESSDFFFQQNWNKTFPFRFLANIIQFNVFVKSKWSRLNHFHESLKDDFSMGGLFADNTIRNRVIYFTLTCFKTNFHLFSFISDPPVIREAPKDQIVRAGGIAAFLCVATGDPTPHITWRKNGNKISLTTSRLVRLLN